MSSTDTAPAGAASPSRKFRTLAIAPIGGGGGKFGQRTYDLLMQAAPNIHRDLPQNIGLVLTDMNRRALDLRKQSCAGAKIIQLGNGLGSGCMPERAKDAFVAKKDEFLAALKDYKIVLVPLAGGKGTAGGAGVPAIQALEEAGHIVFTIVLYPSRDWEGVDAATIKRADQLLAELEQANIPYWHVNGDAAFTDVNLSPDQAHDVINAAAAQILLDLALLFLDPATVDVSDFLFQMPGGGKLGLVSFDIPAEHLGDDAVAQGATVEGTTGTLNGLSKYVKDNCKSPLFEFPDPPEERSQGAVPQPGDEGTAPAVMGSMFAMIRDLPKMRQYGRVCQGLAAFRSRYKAHPDSSLLKAPYSSAGTEKQARVTLLYGLHRPLPQEKLTARAERYYRMVKDETADSIIPVTTDESAAEAAVATEVQAASGSFATVREVIAAFDRSGEQLSAAEKVVRAAVRHDKAWPEQPGWENLGDALTQLNLHRVLKKLRDLGGQQSLLRYLQKKFPITGELRFAVGRLAEQALTSETSDQVLHQLRECRHFRYAAAAKAAGDLLTVAGIFGGRQAIAGFFSGATARSVQTDDPMSIPEFTRSGSEAGANGAKEVAPHK